MTKVALAVSATIFATSAMATNGTNMTGVGTQSNALGGTGVAAYFGAENVIVNPGMIGKSTGTEFTFGGTLFMPNVDTSNTISQSASGGVSPESSGSSTADTNVIPSVAFTTRINENLSFGIGMFGTSGMGVDYMKEDALFNAQTTMQVMKFVPTLAYNEDNFGIGFSPVIQYGSLDMNYKTDNNGDGDTNDAGDRTYGTGMAQDLGLGFNLGGYFDVNKSLTLAASYQSAIDMKYDGQLTTAADGFGIGPNGTNTISSNHLEQPAEIKIGVAYTMDHIMLTADAKQVKWGDAKGYSDFGWEDQNVFALGAKYTGDKYWVGAGYNFGSNPIDEQPGSNMVTEYDGAAINMFNNTFFPATTESHISIGGGYKLTKNATIEGAVVYAPEVSTTVDTTGVSQAFAYQGAIAQSFTPAQAGAFAVGTDPSSSTTTHSQIGYTLSVRYSF